MYDDICINRFVIVNGVMVCVKWFYLYVKYGFKKCVSKCQRRVYVIYIWYLF